MKRPVQCTQNISLYSWTACAEFSLKVVRLEEMVIAPSELYSAFCSNTLSCFLQAVPSLRLLPHESHMLTFSLVLSLEVVLFL
jgi:hypothetical protein